LLLERSEGTEEPVLSQIPRMGEKRVGETNEKSGDGARKNKSRSNLL